MTVASFFLVLGLGAAVYAYVIYPALLYLLALRKPRSGKRESFSDWPRVSITVPAYNEGETIEHTLDHPRRCDHSGEGGSHGLESIQSLPTCRHRGGISRDHTIARRSCESGSGV